MASNIITPPDFVEDQLHTVLLVDATPEEAELVFDVCRYGYEEYNIYMYTQSMDDINWLKQAIEKSDVILVNSSITENNWICGMDKTLYYGEQQFLSPAKKISGVLEYFKNRQTL